MAWMSVLYQNQKAITLPALHYCVVLFSYEVIQYPIHMMVILIGCEDQEIQWEYLVLGVFNSILFETV